MPQTTLLLYCEQDGSVPLIEWLDSLPTKARIECLQRLELLAERGSELRRPHADILASTGLHELRVKSLRINYRILYFFQGQNIVVVSHGFTKEKRIPPIEIATAQQRRVLIAAQPKQHTFDPRQPRHG